MANNNVVVDPQALYDLLHDPAGPVGDILRDIGDQVAAEAVLTAPVSPRGSRYSPPGELKAETRRSYEVHVDDNGELIVFVGSPRFPHNFIDSASGFTRNRGGRSVRRADNHYLEDSLTTIQTVWP